LRRSGTTARSILRLAEDHLLLCDYRAGFIERYKRFYLRDIEAFIIRRTVHWIAAVIIWGLSAVLFLVIGSAAGWNKIVTATLVGICGSFIIWNLVRGPSCRTHIQTAVQTDRLPMLKRLRKTERVLRSLFPLIEQAQGKLEPGTRTAEVDLVSKSKNVLASTNETTVSLAAAAGTEITDISPLHILTFALVLLGGLFAIWEVNFPSMASLTAVIAFFCLASISAVLALVRQGKRRVHSVAAAMTWAVVISYIVGGLGVQTVFTWTDAFMRERLGATAPNARAPLMHQPTPFEMRNLPGFAGVLWVFGILSIMMGALGLIFALSPPPPRAQPPPLPQDNRA
jgi:hypothetical protein